MNNVPITLTDAKEPRIDSRLVAQLMDRQHKAMMALIGRYAHYFRKFGHLTFKKAGGERAQGGGTSMNYALLNEDQSYFLLTLVRNSETVVNLKALLVLAFREARQRRDLHYTEYLPSYHALHDEITRLAGDSPNERLIHMNVNKAVNRIMGIKSGERQGLPLPRKALLIVAQTVACTAMATSHDHKHGYQSVKRDLQILHRALEVVPIESRSTAMHV